MRLALAAGTRLSVLDVPFPRPDGRCSLRIALQKKDVFQSQPFLYTAFLSVSPPTISSPNRGADERHARLDDIWTFATKTTDVDRPILLRTSPEFFHLWPRGMLISHQGRRRHHYERSDKGGPAMNLNAANPSWQTRWLSFFA